MSGIILGESPLARIIPPYPYLPAYRTLTKTEIERGIIILRGDMALLGLDRRIDTWFQMPFGIMYSHTIQRKGKPYGLHIGRVMRRCFDAGQRIKVSRLTDMGCEVLRVEAVE